MGADDHLLVFIFDHFIFSLILSLENTRPYWKSNLVMGLFLIFLFLGYRRSFILKNHAIKIKYAAFWKDQNIPLQDIDSVTPVKRGVKIKYVGKAEPTFYLMRKKVRQLFCPTILKVKSNKALTTK